MSIKKGLTEAHTCCAHVQTGVGMSVQELQEPEDDPEEGLGGDGLHWQHKILRSCILDIQIPCQKVPFVRGHNDYVHRSHDQLNLGNDNLVRLTLPVSRVWQGDKSYH